jgi:amidase
MLPVAQASDGGGSIRIPAAWCGLFGIKPGPGIVPLAGGLTEHWFGMSQWGPLATTVADGALLLDVLAGVDRYRDVRPPSRSLRIAVSTRAPAAGVRTDRQVRAAAEAAGETLRRAGHTITLTDPPAPVGLAMAFLHRFFAGIAFEVDDLKLPIEKLEPRTQRMVRIGRWLLRRRPVGSADVWRERFTAWFGDYDALITPTTARPGVPADGWMDKSLPATLQNGTNYTAFTQPWNVASFPAASVPAGLTEDGFPIGAQLVAPRGGEALVLSIAAQLEEIAPWPRHAPLAGVKSPVAVPA